MNLSKAELPDDTVRTLRRFNIQDVETLLSIVATAAGLLALSRLLKVTTDAVLQMGEDLRRRFPDLEIKPATARPLPPMGHRLPKPFRTSATSEEV